MQFCFAVFDIINNFSHNPSFSQDKTLINKTTYIIHCVGIPRTYTGVPEQSTIILRGDNYFGWFWVEKFI